MAPTADLTLPLDDLGEGLGAASTVLRANAATAGLDAPVPTCPGWTVLDLVVHQGMVHRWAASQLRCQPVTDTDLLERAGRESDDVLDWFDAGATDLLQAIVDAPDDLEAPVFLLEAPAPKVFWARRQCHETTIHAVDALAARLGRLPRTDELWIRPRVALDGIDELLRGFVPRRRQRVHAPRHTGLLVTPDDADVGWHLTLSPDATPVVAVVPRGDGRPVDQVMSGSAVELYVRLWSRGEARDATDHWWRDTVNVTW